MRVVYLFVLFFFVLDGMFLIGNNGATCSQLLSRLLCAVSKEACGQMLCRSGLDCNYRLSAVSYGLLLLALRLSFPVNTSNGNSVALCLELWMCS